MNTLLIATEMAILGLLLGSFAGATVWRLRAKQLVEDKREGEEVDKKEFKRLEKLTKPRAGHDRSRCLECNHQLAWYDLLPLVSWLSLRGRCRYCHKPIGWFEPVIECVVAVFFVMSYVLWPHALSGPVEVLLFGLWLAAGLGLAILLAYDARWFLLPNQVMFPVIAVAALSSIVRIASSPHPLATAISCAGAVAILSGLYFVLYLISRGQWIGFGDIKLGLALGLLLADWRLALLTLFLANLIGCVVVLPAMITKKLGRYSHIPFGPMLIAGWFIAGLWGEGIIAWYLGLTFGISA